MSTNKAKRARVLRRQQERAHRNNAALTPAATLPPAPPRPSLSRRAQEADTHDHLREALRKIARIKSEWAGIPMPLQDSRLVLEPRYPYAALAKIYDKPGEESDEQAAAREGWKLRSRFWSYIRRCEVIVFQEADGRITHGYLPGVHNVEQQLATLGAADAWGMEQEEKALELLAGITTARQLKQYLLTGSFLERSNRSGLTYMFRRLRPTAVIAADPSNDKTRVTCTLCLHPIAYYSGSWGGAMCPTDDVIAHLMLMRGDEPMFWRRANQHPPHRPEAGL